jgi:caffeoyl-CoA O-methyltransferase
MKINENKKKIKILFTGFLLLLLIPAQSQTIESNAMLDKQVKEFLDSQQGRWRDMNIPMVDGKILHDLIVNNNIQNALEIGTSTGHSSIWIAWALSKTGGKLITIDIDEDRHKQALKNFKEAGLDKYIDARLGDAHKLVPELSGPFDFVFSDADKDWYKIYFITLDPKLSPNGLYVTHNVFSKHKTGTGPMSDYVRYVLSLKNYSSIFDDSGNGLLISRKSPR